MERNLKKFCCSTIFGILVFVLFGFNFISQKMSYGGAWWSRNYQSGFGLIKNVSGFGGFLVCLLSVMVLICAGLIVLFSFLGILNETNKAKISFGKLSIELLVKWIMFITLCLTFLNVFLVLINSSVLNAKYGHKTFKIYSSSVPLLIFVASGISYVIYCIFDKKFLWLPSFWEKFGSKNKNKKSSEVETDKTAEIKNNEKSENNENNENDKNEKDSKVTQVKEENDEAKNIEAQEEKKSDNKKLKKEEK